MKAKGTNPLDKLVGDLRTVAGRAEEALERGRRSSPARSLPRTIRDALQTTQEWCGAHKALPSRADVPILLEHVIAAAERTRDLMGTDLVRTKKERQTLLKLRSLLLALRTRCEVAERLYQHRREHGLTLHDLGERVGLGQPHVGKLERLAVGLPSLESCQLLLEELGMCVTRCSQEDEGSAPRAIRAVVGDSERSRELDLLDRRVAQLSTDDICVVRAMVEALVRRRRSQHSSEGIQDAPDPWPTDQAWKV